MESVVSTPLTVAQVHGGGPHPEVGFTSRRCGTTFVSTMSLHRPARALSLAFCLFVLLSASAGLEGQVVSAEPSSGAMLTRTDLTTLLDQYEKALESPAYSDRIKNQIRSEAQRVRDRLQHGDFRPGDRVVLTVEGQPNLPDTVAVEPGPKITLPVFGDISLQGVLRSEITDHLTQALGKMIRNPVVHAQGLMRLSVQGAVGQPGFYVVPTDILVSEAIMKAGGPGSDANLGDLRIERGTKVVYQGKELQTAMREGKTLDQLSLQAGDQIVLPAKKGSIWGSVARYGFIIASTLLLGVRIAG